MSAHRRAAMRRTFTIVSVGLMGFALAAGPATPAAARSCSEVLAGHVYSCSGTNGFSTPEGFDLSFVSWPGALYSGVSGRCACLAKGRPTNPDFEGSTDVLCTFPSLDLALEGRAAGSAIKKGFWINAVTQTAFACTRNP
jgi:hypothetical protein